jgi:catalase
VVDNFFAETEQVAFCTQNIVPGVDFTNDPLLQGRNFSYLDTQLKRLGGPNFTHLPINAPKCPFAHFQQDGHMAMRNPTGRINFEPNSSSGEERGPREDPVAGFTSFAEEVAGPKRRLRASSFADHYSQAGQFYRSQTPIEQQHIAAAFTFELSKVERPAIRERMVANLRNVDDGLAQTVAGALGLPALPAASPAAMPPQTDLAESAALSILRNGPADFAGRKLGLLVTDGAAAAVVTGLRRAAEAEGTTLEVIAPAVGGVELDDGTHLDAQQMVGGGPSVLYDAVALVTSEAGAAALAALPAARDFVTDAHAHKKFIGFVGAARPLLAAAGLSDADAGYLALDGGGAAQTFVETCRGLRFWERP